MVNAQVKESRCFVLFILEYISSFELTDVPRFLLCYTDLNVKLYLNRRKPTRQNLDKKENDLDYILEVICIMKTSKQKSTCLVRAVAVEIWKEVFKWWHIPIVSFHDLES